MVDEPNREDTTSESLATIFSGGALVTAGKIFTLGVGFLVQVTMARLLTEGAYGDVVLAIAVINISTLFGKLGLDEGVTREYSHYEDEPTKARGVIRAGLIIACISGVVVGITLFLASPFLATEVFNDSSLTLLFQLISISVPFLTLTDVSVSLAQGSRNARVHTIVRQLLQPTLRLILIFALLIGGYGAIGAIAGQSASLIIAGVLSVFLALRQLPDFEVESANMYRSVLSFSIPLVAVQGMGFLNSNVDVYMVGYFLESAQLGIYNIALQMSNMSMALLGSVGFLLPPMLTRLQKEEKFYEMKRTYQVLTKWIVVLILPVIGLLLFAPGPIIRLLFGEAFVAGATALQILLIGNVLTIVMGLNSSALIALGNNKLVSYIIAVQAVINIVINVLLIPIIGIEGAAIGMAVSLVVGDIFGVAAIYRFHGIHPFTRAILYPVFGVGIVSVASIIFVSKMSYPLYIVAAIVGVLYIPIVAIFAPEPEDEQLLRRVEDITGYNFGFVRKIYN